MIKEVKGIILFGAMGAGKSKTANLIQKILAEQGFNTEVISLGAKIKEIQADLHYNSKQINRQEQQGVGQGMRDIFGNEVWCQYLKNEYDIENDMDGPIWIIDDGRQLSEFEFWKREGFIGVGLSAEKEVRAKRLLKRDGVDQSHRMDHETEISAIRIAADRCDYTIYNGGTLDELEIMVRQIIGEVSR